MILMYVHELTRQSHVDSNAEQYQFLTLLPKVYDIFTFFFPDTMIPYLHDKAKLFFHNYMYYNIIVIMYTNRNNKYTTYIEILASVHIDIIINNSK